MQNILLNTPDIAYDLYQYELPSWLPDGYNSVKAIDLSFGASYFNTIVGVQMYGKKNLSHLESFIKNVPLLDFFKIDLPGNSSVDTQRFLLDVGIQIANGTLLAHDCQTMYSLRRVFIGSTHLEMSIPDGDYSEYLELSFKLVYYAFMPITKAYTGTLSADAIAPVPHDYSHKNPVMTGILN